MDLGVTKMLLGMEGRIEKRGTFVNSSGDILAQGCTASAVSLFEQVT